MSEPTPTTTTTATATATAEDESVSSVPASGPRNGPPPAIMVDRLHRRFGSLRAVDGVSFEVGQGQVVGFVGANGAGKTTTMRILATLDYPSSGKCEIMGRDVVNYPTEVRASLGWMPDSFGTYDHMTVLEYLDFYGRALGYRGDERQRRLAEVMEFTELDRIGGRLINALSKGMGQRLCLGRALIHDPDVLILDEPAAGLDPKARVELKHLIRVLADDGKTILISSHILSELGEMCDSLLFINAGRIVHHGTAESLKRGTQAGTLLDIRVAGDPERLSEWCAMNPGVELKEARQKGARVEVESEDDTEVAGVLRRMISDGLEVCEFHREERNLEDAFIDLLGTLEGGEQGTRPDQEQ